MAKPQMVTNRHKAIWEEAAYFELLKEHQQKEQQKKEAEAAQKGEQAEKKDTMTPD